ncbi:glutathione S-transferase T3-like [Lactuca sativa]|uniref:glutathione S-transferase T3-like n=1 Tax=Lactuca sativa TaxID=4236 RepID=UPI0022B02EB0|nr:glutathione S-transferase T3-like [Lactuca sativa]
MQFPTSFYMQQNPYLQQNVFNTFTSMPQTTTQPMQETIPEAQAGDSQKGRGKRKRKGKEIMETEEAPPLWWTPEKEYVCAVAWCETSKNPAVGNDMRRVGFWKAVLVKFHVSLKKQLYHNIYMLSSKWTPINRWCTKFIGIFIRLSSQKQSGANEFNVFKAAREQYHVEIGHAFKYKKIWELVRIDPKWIQN